jgi:protein-S-isoprenylcysteine O-methyltransferase Ste14
MIGQLPLLITTWPLRPTVLELVAGSVLLILGMVLNIWAERLFRWNDVGVCPFSRVPLLIDRGPYRLTRNPMYLGLISLNLGATLVSGVLANAWSSIAFVIWLHYAYVLPEEAFLRNQLGSTFDAYAERVPRWIRFA